MFIKKLVTINYFKSKKQETEIGLRLGWAFGLF